MRMRFSRIAAFIAALAVFITVHSALAISPADYDMNAPENLVAEHLFCESALLVDAATGEILFSNNSRVRMYPASTTKIATLYLGIKGGIDLEEIITVPKEAADIDSGSSVIPVEPGDELRYRDLLYSFMMTSGNDGANTIAVLTSGSIPAFVEKMNAWVNEIGCTSTHFTNPHGLHDDGHYTTAQDLALMTRVAMQDETFRDIVACEKLEMPVRRNGEITKGTIETRNNLLISGQKYYYKDCIGVKTGHTRKAGYCFVGAAERDGMEVISVVLNCPEDHQKWYDSAKLFEYGFTRYEDISIAQLYTGVKSDIARVYVEGADAEDVGGGYLELDIASVSNPDVSVKAVKGSEISLGRMQKMFADNAKVVLNSDIHAPVNAGDVLGSLEYTTPEGETVTAQLTASRSVEKQPESALEQLFGPDGGSGIITVLMILLAVMVFAGIILFAVARARQKKRHRMMMERRRRAQMQKNGGYPAGRMAQSARPVNRRR